MIAVAPNWTLAVSTCSNVRHIKTVQEMETRENEALYTHSLAHLLRVITMHDLSEMALYGSSLDELNWT